MSYYLISIGLFLAAYFLGTWTGCLLRRLIAPGRAAIEEPTVDVPSAAAASSVAATHEPPPEDRFSRALTGAGQVGGAPPADELPSPAAAQSAPMKTTFEPVATRLENIPERAPHVTAPSGRPIPATHVEGPAGAGFVSAEVVMGAVAATAAAAAGAVAGTETGTRTDATSAIPAEPDDLHLLRGIDDQAISSFHEAGITRFAEIAALTAPEVRRLDKRLGHDGRIAGANWIEQAQALASGRETHYARTVHARAGVRLAHPGTDTGEPLQIFIGSLRPKAVPILESELTLRATHETLERPPEATVAALAAATAVAARVTGDGSVTSTHDRSQLQQGDDLARISGITPEIARALSTRGVTSFAHVAGWTETDVNRVESLLGTTGRIDREKWIIQARGFAGLPAVDTEPQSTGRAHDVTPAEPEEGPPQSTSGHAGNASAALAGLRSVRSEAYTTAPAQVGEPDDLKRIRGVGVLIEKKLHMLGVRTYDQIANWTRSEIDRVSEQLDFHGRIERENWIEQARILLAGGQTQFSRRFDTNPGRRPLSGGEDGE